MHSVFSEHQKCDLFSEGCAHNSCYTALSDTVLFAFQPTAD